VGRMCSRWDVRERMCVCLGWDVGVRLSMGRLEVDGVHFSQGRWFVPEESMGDTWMCFELIPLSSTSRFTIGGGKNGKGCCAHGPRLKEVKETSC
jgi:hypothetical protein